MASRFKMPGTLPNPPSSHGLVMAQLDETQLLRHNWDTCLISIRDQICKAINGEAGGYTSIPEWDYRLMHPEKPVPSDYSSNELTKARYLAEDNRIGKLRGNFLGQLDMVGSIILRHIPQRLISKLRLCGSFTTANGTYVESYNTVTADEAHLDPQHLLLHLHRILTQPGVYKANAGYLNKKWTATALELQFHSFSILDTESLPDCIHRLRKTVIELTTAGCITELFEEERLTILIYLSLTKSPRFIGLQEECERFWGPNSGIFPENLELLTERVQQVMVHRNLQHRPNGSQMYSMQQGIDIPLTASQQSAIYINSGGSYVDKYPKDGPKPKSNKKPTSVIPKDSATNTSWRPT